jgi:hypothetical protein
MTIKDGETNQAGKKINAPPCVLYIRTLTNTAQGKSNPEVFA